MSVGKLNSDNNKIKVLTADILQQYHQGSLTPEQMNQVEKLLLDDPFAADALEGIEVIEDGISNFETSTNTLNQRIDKRVNRDKRVIVPLYRRPLNIAAAVLILLISGYLITTYSDLFNPLNATDSSLSMNKKGQPEDIESPATESESGEIVKQQNQLKESNKGDTPNNNGEPTGINVHKKAAENEGKVASESQKNDFIAAAPKPQPNQAPKSTQNENREADNDDVFTFADDEEVTEVEDIAMAEEIALDEQVVFEEEINDAEKKEEKSLARSQRALGANTSAKKKALNSIVPPAELSEKLLKGQVIAANTGLGMPGVSLNVVGSDRGAFSDINGNYRIKLLPKDSLISFSFVGFESEEIKIEDKDELNVDLEPENMALSEVVITAYNEDNENQFIPIIGAAPLGGNTKYKKYLKENLKYPQEALDNKIEGKVKVTFNVDPNGHLTDFNVRRSLGYGCDEEVLRLIKTGPKWQPAKKGDATIKQKVRVRVKFKIQK